MKGLFKTTAGEIAAITGGKIVSGNSDVIIETISTDSRELDVNTLFIPIIGETFDGHNFIDELSVNGKIACSLTMKEGYEKSAADSGTVLIMCDDTLSALGKIGRFHRDKFRPVTFGVTGTNGKTTTKELIYAVLSSVYKTHKNVKNYNNEIGVPFTLLQLDESHEAAVIEMGMNHTGEIERLSLMVQPEIGVITNIGAGHLEFLGSMENVAFAKCEIMKGMKKGSTLIANRDTECFHIIKKLADEKGIKLFTFGLDAGSDLRPDSYKLTAEKTVVVYKKETVTVPLYGKHNVYNILAALAAAEILNIKISRAAEALSSFVNVGGRSEIIDRKYTVINDTYNSNPLSSLFALESVCDVFQGRRKIAVLADMKELGESSCVYHVKVGEFAGARKFDLLLLYGEMAEYYEKGALSAGMNSSSVKIFDSKEEIVLFLKDFLLEDDVVLVKGSRSMKMEDVVNRLIA
ncbi:MAG TPA: UDP-N-acetylmuramoyl-tripeptide--D-alanyl-D-alanine ligase [Spirochaetota bacterium]|nr:UDP-N-acetylmuramoyl-tripeptide--D-alanyl-D-alanine ligase [Spirochaetota bacterium]HPS87564.1 UDP-N-acetylmuramoyl-tripeptide--D-alanyl-D-alanine ligase [Spirochaetota bacterium]